MILPTFKEANDLFKGGLVTCYQSSDTAAFFMVTTFKKDKRKDKTYPDIEKINKVMVSNKGYLKILCDCEYTSIKGEACGGLCKHKIAVIRELVRLNGKVDIG